MPLHHPFTPIHTHQEMGSVGSTRAADSHVWKAASVLVGRVAAPLCVVAAAGNQLSKAPIPRLEVIQKPWCGAERSPCVMLHNDGSVPLRIHKMTFDGEADVRGYLVTKGIHETTLEKLAFRCGRCSSTVDVGDHAVLMMPRKGAALTKGETKRVVDAIRDGFSIELQYALPFGMWRTVKHTCKDEIRE